MKMQPSDPRAVEQIDTVFGRRDEAFSKDEREARLLGLERIANSVRARRSKSEGPQPTPVNPRKGRIRA